MSCVIDDIHALFAAWQDTSDTPLDPFGVEVMKLAVHEWIANLVQHADFGSRPARIRLTLHPEGSRVRCLIEDNSRGFDFARQIVHQQHSLSNAQEPPDRGRGLLLMIACTENLSYLPVPYAASGDGAPDGPWHRLEFWVSPYPPFDTAPAEAAFETDESEELAPASGGLTLDTLPRELVPSRRSPGTDSVPADA